jgi:uncharacterized protein
MSDKPLLPDPIDLDALRNYLISDHAPDNCMDLSDLDGFLAGIIVGPESILPSEWLPVIWDGEEPEFASEDEMRTVLSAIMGRYDEIVTCLNDDSKTFDPIFWEGPDGQVIAADWAAGFLDAVALRPRAWEPLITHHRAGMMMLPILLLNGDAEFDAGPDDAVEEEDFLAEVPDIIPACVAGIHEFWSRRRERQKPMPNRNRRSPGGGRRRP